jgi:hypothetical protein
MHIKEKTNLIEKPFMIVRPSDGREFHKSKFISEAPVILRILKWMLCGANVDICAIASLLKMTLDCTMSANKRRTERDSA